MTARDLRYFDHFYITDSKIPVELDWVNRRYPKDIDKPWMVCSGARLDLFTIVRNGVHITISPDTEVIYDNQLKDYMTSTTTMIQQEQLDRISAAMEQNGYIAGQTYGYKMGTDWPSALTSNSDLSTIWWKENGETKETYIHELPTLQEGWIYGPFTPAI